MIATLVEPVQMTPKGSSNEKGEFDAYTFACIAILIGITALGIFINLVPVWSKLGDGEGSRLVCLLGWCGTSSC